MIHWKVFLYCFLKTHILSVQIKSQGKVIKSRLLKRFLTLTLCIFHSYALYTVFVFHFVWFMTPRRRHFSSKLQHTMNTIILVGLQSANKENISALKACCQGSVCRQAETRRDKIATQKPQLYCRQRTNTWTEQWKLRPEIQRQI